MICVNNELPDGTYIKEDMIFRIEHGKRVFVKGVAIKSPPFYGEYVFYRLFYSVVAELITSPEEQTKLSKLIQIPGQRMFFEARYRNFLNTDINLDHTDVFNLDLISTKNGGIICASWVCLDPNHIEVTMITSLEQFNEICSRSSSSKFNYVPSKSIFSNSSPLSTTLPHLSSISTVKYAEQEFLLGPRGAILYIDDRNQIFFYYNPDYLLKKHTRKDITASNKRLMDDHSRIFVAPRQSITSVPRPQL
jgi:hypothetical protein